MYETTASLDAAALSDKEEDIGCSTNAKRKKIVTDSSDSSKKRCVTSIASKRMKPDDIPFVHRGRKS